GVTMTTALVSLLRDVPVRSVLGMTGEVTLQGRVLPIGGVRQKVLAAHRAGLTTVVLPVRNGPDLEDVPGAVRSGMTFPFPSDLGEVPHPALAPARPPPGAGWPPDPVRLPAGPYDPPRNPVMIRASSSGRSPWMLWPAPSTTTTSSDGPGRRNAATYASSTTGERLPRASSTGTPIRSRTSHCHPKSTRSTWSPVVEAGRPI